MYYIKDMEIGIIVAYRNDENLHRIHLYSLSVRHIFLHLCSTRYCHCIRIPNTYMCQIHQRHSVWIHHDGNQTHQNCLPSTPRIQSLRKTTFLRCLGKPYFILNATAVDLDVERRGEVEGLRAVRLGNRGPPPASL